MPITSSLYSTSPPSSSTHSAFAFSTNTISYNLLKSTYSGINTLNKLKNLSKTYPKLGNGFTDFLYNYYDFGNRETLKLKNKILFSLENEKDYYQAIIYYISGMTDNFAIEIYNEIIHF